MNFRDTAPDRRRRERLVRDYCAGADPAVRAAMLAIARHAFVPAGSAAAAYQDTPLAIGAGQTISQPSLVAHMLTLLQLQPGMRVLDIGCGSGYVSALIARIVGPSGAVFALERQGSLSGPTASRLAALRSAQDAPITLVHGDGTLGWPEAAPFDAIHVGCAFPDTQSVLSQQLARAGRLLQPITEGGEQRLQLVQIQADGTVHVSTDLAVQFVPLLPGRV